jgi:hypothetical protein
MSLAMVFVPFCNSKNFEDMKIVVKNLYSTEESTDIDFTELLTIGSFDDYSDEDYISDKKEFSTIEEAMLETDGFY